MNYKSEIEMIDKFMDLAGSNIQNYRDGDIPRCYYTDGMMEGLTYSLRANGHQVEYLTYIADNGCPRPVSLTVDGNEIIKESAIQFDVLREYKQSLLPVTKVTVYQINSERDHNNVNFINREHLQHLQGSPEVDSGIYDRVYSGELHCSSLENIYEILNANHPENYLARSLSVSDVIHVEKSPIIQDGYYFCDSFDFKSVHFEPELTRDGPMVSSETLSLEQGQTEITNKVLVIRPEDVPEQKEIGFDIASLQKEVDGYIEAVYPFEDNVAIIVNEEGKLNGLPFNRALRDEDGLVFDVTAGTMLVVGIGDETFTGLTEGQIQKYDKIFHDPEQFRYVGGRLVVTKLRKDQHTHAAETPLKKTLHDHSFGR